MILRIIFFCDLILVEIVHSDLHFDDKGVIKLDIGLVGVNVLSFGFAEIVVAIVFVELEPQISKAFVTFGIDGVGLGFLVNLFLESVLKMGIL